MTFRAIEELFWELFKEINEAKSIKGFEKKSSESTKQKNKSGSPGKKSHNFEERQDESEWSCTLKKKNRRTKRKFVTAEVKDKFDRLF